MPVHSGLRRQLGREGACESAEMTVGSPKQLVRRADLEDAAVTHDDDAVHVHDGRDAMRDDNHGRVAKGRRESMLHRSLALEVDGAG